MTEYEKIMSGDIALINNRLSELTGEEAFRGRESQGLDLMRRAMCYSLENGGKRVRPLLALAFCRLFGGDINEAVDGACALEMIHTYSLIHDDLPCMDDDDMRRGKPSNHIAFGYANALLAGDGLLTLAFEVALNAKISAEKRAGIGLLLARAAGAAGMIAGQVCDLANEEREASLDEVRATDRLKTGELIRAAGAIGCTAAGADEKMKSAAEKYCADIGLAFQIIDDILDVTSSSEVLGKPVGSDKENNKSTYVSLLGIQGAKDYAVKLTESAKSAVSGYENSGYLIWFAEKLCGRIN